MTTHAAAPEAAAAPGRAGRPGRPLERARRALARGLAARARAGSLPAPRVAVIGAVNAMGERQHDQGGSREADGGPGPHEALVHLAPDAVLIGPWQDTAGGATACGACLAIRWQRLRTRSERDALETGLVTVPVGDWPPLPDHTVDAVWALYLRATTGGPAQDAGTRHVTPAHGAAAPRAGRSTAPTPAADPVLPRVTRLDLRTLLVRTVPLLPEPLCPHCAPAVAADTAGDAVPSPLVSRPKPDPGGYRLRRPGDHPLPTEALANPVCGVLGAATWRDVTSPTTAPVAGTVFMRGYAGLTDVTWSGQANSFARSRDLAFLEGMERYAGTHRRDRASMTVDSLANLGDAALDPRTCGLYAPETYAADPMVAPFDPERPIPWVTGYSLRDERPVLVPARLVYYSAGTAADNFVFECSNGCAIGSCTEEAVLHGLLELIERDAFLLGWYGDLPLTEIDLDSCASPAVRAMIARAALQGYDVHVFDNRVDLAVPVVTGLAVRRDDGPGALAFAAGAAFDPEVAVESAVAEILTYIPHLPRQVAERPDELAAMARDYHLVRRLPDHAALFGLPQMKRYAGSYLRPPALRPLGAVYAGWQQRRPGTGDLLDDVRLLRDDLVGAGCDVIVVDQTTPEQRCAGLVTVCTLAPGLLPIDFGWARQRALHLPRLRTAARRAGLRATDLTDAELRRVPHPFP